MRPNYFRTFGRFGRNILLRNVHQQKQSQNGPFNTSILGGGALLSAFGLFKSAGNKKEEEVKLPGSDDLIIREADMLYENYLIDNTYNVLRRYRSSENPEFLWRLARVIYEQGNLTKNGDEKKRLFDEALEYAEKALKFEPVSGSFAAHKWYAIILSSTTKLEGKKAQLAKAMDIKWHFERALELNSYDATTWHLLGFWHYSCATLSTLERYGASLLYSTPPQSTIEEALRHFERAEAIRPNFYSANNYYLGLCYEHLNRLAEAEDQLTKAFIAPVISAGDMEIHKLAYQHLKKNYKVNDEKLMEEKK